MALDFARGYVAAVEAARGERVALAKLKQLARWYRCGGLFAGAIGDASRKTLLRQETLAQVLSGIDAEATRATAVAETAPA
jgi:hypothetical protein